ncbi:MAG: V-type ATP synthase subunit E family protein [Bacillota bacterium]
MTGAEKLIESILDEAEKEALEISSQAQQKKEHSRQKLLAALEHRTSDILDQAHKDGRELKKRMLAVYGLELRKGLLREKRMLLDKAYEKALQRMSALPKEEYLSLVSKLLLDIVSTGREEIVIGENEKYIDADFVKGINSMLREKGKEGALSISGEKAAIQGGFILQEGGFVMNCSFETLIKELREKTETQAAQILFD